MILTFSYTVRSLEGHRSVTLCIDSNKEHWEEKIKKKGTRIWIITIPSGFEGITPGDNYDTIHTKLWIYGWLMTPE